MADRVHRLAKQALVILALMTVATLGGPVLVVLVLAGGDHADWPPDRPIEWNVFLGTIAVVLGLMVIGVTIGFANQRAARRARLDRSWADDPGERPKSPA